MQQTAAPRSKRKLSPEEVERRIASAYNTVQTPFSFISGGLRRIAVDPADRRAQMQLLRFGVRYFSKVQTIVHELNRIFQPDVFVDVGSNYGECLFSLPFNATIPALGFEANPALLPYLERSRAYNDDLSVEIVGKAVGPNDAEEAITFFVNKRWSGKSTAARGAAVDGMTEISVPVTSIDRELDRRFPAARAIVMKVDVEGFEPQVMAGAVATVARAELFACLLEFDNGFLESQEGGARGFFTDLASRFRIYLADKRIAPVASYDALDERVADAEGKIHCDLVLLKSSPEALRTFEEHFCQGPTQKLAAAAWGIDAG